MLQPHHLTIPHPLSFNSLDTLGNEIAESLWLTDYNNTGTGVDEYVLDDVSQLQWEYDEERRHMYVTYPDE